MKENILNLITLVAGIINVALSTYLFIELLHGHYASYLELNIITILTSICLIGTVFNNK